MQLFVEGSSKVIHMFFHSSENCTYKHFISHLVKLLSNCPIYKQWHRCGNYMFSVSLCHVSVTFLKSTLSSAHRRGGELTDKAAGHSGNVC